MSRLDLETMSVLIHRLNNVFPKFQLTAELGLQLATEYREALHGFDNDAIDGAVSMWIREGDRFPIPLRLRERAAQWLKVNRPQLLLPRSTQSSSDLTVCDCGCGGGLWARVLLDRSGVPRRFPMDLEPPPAVAHLVSVADIQAFVGLEMTRDQVECRRRDPIPQHARLLRKDARGVPVYTFQSFAERMHA